MHVLSNASCAVRRMDGAMFNRFVDRRLAAGSAGEESGRPINLTARQVECLQWVAEGKSSVDIAGILSLSPATVNEHIADACRRLGVRTRVQATVEAYRMGCLA